MFRIAFLAIAVLAAWPAFAASPAPPPQWTVFIEGGAFWDTRQDVAFFGAGGANNSVGGHGAGGFDYRFDSLWHVSAQFRYYDASSTSTPNPLIAGVTPALCAGPVYSVCMIGIANAGVDVSQRNMVADAAIGRDVSWAPGNAQAKFGFRFADIRMTTTADTAKGALAYGVAGGPGASVSVFYVPPFLAVTTNGSATAASAFLGGFYQQLSQFTGVGPRFAVEGEVPFAQRWSLDYMGGVATLFGERTVSLASSMSAPPFTVPYSFGGKDRTQVAVFNTDASLGISYYFTPSWKGTVGYRVDAYFDALAVGNATSDTAHYIQHGVFGRLTANF